jgi:hypothetical protein
VDKKKRVKKHYKVQQILTYFGEDGEFQNSELLDIAGEPAGEDPKVWTYLLDNGSWAKQ